MAIPVEGYSVVVRNMTLATKYPGGVEAYERDAPNQTFCTDGSLCRIGFMMLSDAERFVADLAGKGLMPFLDGSAEDVALVGKMAGSKPCKWITVGQFRSVPIAWLAGMNAGDLFAPAGWTPEKAVQPMSSAEAKSRLEFVRRQDSVDVYRDKTTGQEYYVGRTASTSAESNARQDALYKQACTLIEGLLQLGGETARPLEGVCKNIPIGS
jgi:hypothetical protein